MSALHYGIPNAGHFVASCGADRVVALWDVALVAEQGVQGGAGAGLGAGTAAGPAIALHGMTAAVNDCAFTCEGSQVGGRPCGPELGHRDATRAVYRDSFFLAALSARGGQCARARP